MHFARREVTAFSAGACYGGGLGVLAWICAGAGHGTYLLGAVTSAPFSALGHDALLFAGPVVWGILALLAALGHRPKCRQGFLIAAAVHYASALVLVFGTDFGALKYLQRVMEGMPFAPVAWAVAYLVGQVALWYGLHRVRATARIAPDGR
ncbi:MAG: hypothetical protein L0Z55_01945 [Planctomycetes bacterium]|nr:hypothetical protein [Planctomycetota bacterium]